MWEHIWQGVTSLILVSLTNIKVAWRIRDLLGQFLMQSCSAWMEYFLGS
ncbi:MAG: hypothetical protein Hyperionvirus15_1 [Hyperionvirus sp.]|uniref:Uncharacterized protein n=1 Tax=Hyperionvirus sp. TaxID=2487770 RepID=A0A3G5ADJ7_9VIRU|nr:MAG: hypothetical protein Hyperionvirus15_1 [Hyperionvirus sp.]